MVDKNYCMSSYLAFRYIEDINKNFSKELKHEHFKSMREEEKIKVRTAEDIDNEIKKVFKKIEKKKKGILLSGGMDSAILASYMPGSDAYTFRFLDGNFQKDELERAEAYAKKYNLTLHYVDINWNTVIENLDPILKMKAAPVHSIEPQLLQASLQAKKDGVEIIITGESSDGVFGGMDGLLSKDWSLEDFKKRYTFLDPIKVLKNPVNLDSVYEKYKINTDKINFLKFIDEIFGIESSGSYFNAFKTADIKHIDPYAHLKMAEPLDLGRVRNGESKYLIRELFKMKYPEIPVPEKVPMPRPVDEYFKNWEGPTRDEFLSNLDMNEFTGNQKWQLYCLEYFLNLFNIK